MERIRQVSVAEARDTGEQLRVDWTKVDLDQFRSGLEVEFEHGARDLATNVTNDDLLLTGKIAWAHLKDCPHYYTRLERLEAAADNYWASRREDALAFARTDADPNSAGGSLGSDTNA